MIFPVSESQKTDMNRVSSFVSSDAGAEAQKKVWRELSSILERIQPGVMSSV